MNTSNILRLAITSSLLAAMAPAAHAAIIAEPTNCLIGSGSVHCTTQLYWDVVPGTDVYAVPLVDGVPDGEPMAVFPGCIGNYPNCEGTGGINWINHSGYEFQLRNQSDGAIVAKVPVRGLDQTAIQIQAEPASCQLEPGPDSQCTVNLSWPASSAYDLFVTPYGNDGEGTPVSAGDPDPGSGIVQASLPIHWISSEGFRFSLRTPNETIAHLDVRGDPTSGELFASGSCQAGFGEQSCAHPYSWQNVQGAPFFCAWLAESASLVDCQAWPEFTSFSGTANLPFGLATMTLRAHQSWPEHDPNFISSPHSVMESGWLIDAVEVLSTESGPPASISATPQVCSIPTWDSDCDVALTWEPARSDHWVRVRVTNAQTGAVQCNPDCEPIVYRGDANFTGTPGVNAPISWITAHSNYQFQLVDQSGTVVASTDVSADLDPTEVQLTNVTANPCSITSGGSCNVTLSWHADGRYNLVRETSLGSNTWTTIAAGSAGGATVSATVGTQRFGIRLVDDYTVAGAPGNRLIATIDVSAQSAPAQVDFISTAFGDMPANCPSGEWCQTRQLQVFRSTGGGQYGAGGDYTVARNSDGRIQATYTSGVGANLEQTQSYYRVLNGVAGYQEPVLAVYEEFFAVRPAGGDPVGQQLYPTHERITSGPVQAPMVYESATVSSASPTSNVSQYARTCYVAGNDQSQTCQIPTSALPTIRYFETNSEITTSQGRFVLIVDEKYQSCANGQSAGALFHKQLIYDIDTAMPVGVQDVLNNSKYYFCAVAGSEECVRNRAILEQVAPPSPFTPRTEGQCSGNASFGRKK